MTAFPLTCYYLVRMTEQEALAAFVKRHGTQTAAAEHLGLSSQYVSDLLKGYRKCSARVLDKLGYRWKKSMVRKSRKARQLIGTK